MPIILIIVVLLILAGVVYMVRSPAQPPVATPWNDADATVLRQAVLDRMRERLVGWNFEAPADRPLELTAIEERTERRLTMNLRELTDRWYPLHSQGKTAEADELVESLVAGATRQDEGTDAEMDPGEARDLLALRLSRADKVPAKAMSRPVGELRATLVLRDSESSSWLTGDDLAKLGLTETEAFRCAFENLQRDVEEGLEVESLDDEDPSGAISIAPRDRLAPSYALVPGLAAKIRKLAGKKEVRLFVDETSLTAVTDGVELEREKPLLPEPIALDALAWKSVPE